ncbi:hypothetical protein BBJ29_009523 [Phytophthora kernoviae]|uniref:Uncharacterized protein n=1 Tax=Phytophthora kernoviae TaxID=325452 RepID=A0A3F2S3P0_9STRA|nr:hypothetical protein BBJ29_009523 [Phytophthora kernoviae]RLN68898.1 hypothetical protein BBP00_00000776 [Phytophthora kernoviae]
MHFETSAGVACSSICQQTDIRSPATVGGGGDECHSGMPLVFTALAVQKSRHCLEYWDTCCHAVVISTRKVCDIGRAPTKNLALEMCVFDIEQQEKCWHIELIDHHLEPQFRALAKPYKPLSLAHHSKYDFQLSIWKNRGPQLNAPNYRDGFWHRFEKVQSL